MLDGHPAGQPKVLRRQMRQAAVAGGRVGSARIDSASRTLPQKGGEAAGLLRPVGDHQDAARERQQGDRRQILLQVAAGPGLVGLPVLGEPLQPVRPPQLLQLPGLQQAGQQLFARSQQEGVAVRRRVRDDLRRQRTI